MSRIADVVQVSSIDRRISHCLQRIPCGRCYAVIEYDRGAEWSVVSKLANEHWKACPGKPHAWQARMARTPTSPPDTAIALPPLVALKQPSGPAAESVGSQNTTWIAPGCERKRRTLEQRKRELEQDEYAKNVTTKSVVCGGCHREISLDKRSKYYPGLWLKHKGKCPNIERLERTKAKVPHGLNGARQVPYDVVTSSDSEGDGVQLGPAECCESHGAATTQQRSVRHPDSESPSSEENDEDGGIPAHEPFPTLNSDFYRTERYYNRADEWAYRYATKDEITTNLFRGQDAPYARPGSRPFTPQTGCQWESSRHDIKNRVELQAVSHPDGFRSTKALGGPDKNNTPHTHPSWCSAQ